MCASVIVTATIVTSTVSAAEQALNELATRLVASTSAAATTLGVQVSMRLTMPDRARWQLRSRRGAGCCVVPSSCFFATVTTVTGD